MAALEAEKFLAEHEVVQNGPEADTDVRKGKSEADGDVPEYRQNPLL
jgi:thioredoxin reductase (NADPH)